MTYKLLFTKLNFITLLFINLQNFMLKRLLQVVMPLLCVTGFSYAQSEDAIITAVDSTDIVSYQAPSHLEEAIAAQFAECDGSYPQEIVLNQYGYPACFVPTYDESVIQARLNEMNVNSAISYDYNSSTLAYVKLFSNNKREMMSRMIGLAELYFPLFEQKLAEHGLPKELKYLAIIESALNPTAKSRAGATGLWQFMQPTGKLFGLVVNNDIDERKDPYQATEAACKYLKELYGMFGDWQLALSAYNAGPGTIRKAITKSGGIKNYWELRPYLPKETQGYVPAFIGAAYVMNFSREHNICPTKAKYAFGDITTVQIADNFSFNHLADVLEVPVEDLKYLNPVYKNDQITVSSKPHTICLPKDRLCDFNYCEQDIYNLYLCSAEEQELSEANNELAEAAVAKTHIRTHVVKKGESLGLIANRYRCSVSELMAWNELKKGTIYPGQKLSVHTIDVAQLMAQTPESTNKQEQTETKVATKVSEFIYYTVQKGDTLWDIANQSGVSVAQLKELNNIQNEKSLIPGTRIKVSVTG